MARSSLHQASAQLTPAAKAKGLFFAAAGISFLLSAVRRRHAESDGAVPKSLPNPGSS